MVQIYNTLTRQKEQFKPMVEGKIDMYVCGITIYDFCHIGHARTFVGFDVIVRYLRHLGYDLKYVRNITDVDDKIIKRANENGESINDLTLRMTQAMHEDFDSLNMLRPDIEPTVTNHMDEIIEMVERLIAKGHAYVANDGDVLFDVSTFEQYGALSQQDLSMLQAGSRVEVAQDKDDPLDFVLWKKAKAGEPSWSSPWGEGRPGWHLECSAMILKYLGRTFDLHSGGEDLVFPHHENELAQSKCSCGGEFARHWFHSTHLLVNGKKMSKSSGTLYTLSDLANEGWTSMEVRYVLIGANYRKQLNFTMESLHAAREALGRLAKAAKDHAVPGYRELSKGGGLGVFAGAFKRLNEDLNTAAALGELFANLKNARSLEDWRGFFTVLTSLGLTLPEPKGIEVPEKIAKLAECRWEARQNKDWAASDRYRDQLAENGWMVKDGREGYEVLPL